MVARPRNKPDRRAWALIRQYGGTPVRYADLPRPAQLAIAHYMVIDGEAWTLPEWTADLSVKQLKAKLPALLPYLKGLYGNKPFGYVRIPMNALADAIMHDEDISRDFKTFDDYHAWYMGHDDIPKHTSRDLWPVILDTDNGFEVLQDGSHRLHRYYQLGVRSVPAVYYLPRVLCY